MFKHAGLKLIYMLAKIGCIYLIRLYKPNIFFNCYAFYLAERGVHFIGLKH